MLGGIDFTYFYQWCETSPVNYLELPQREKVRRGGDNSLIWRGGGGASFSVNHLYKAIAIQGGERFPVKAIWGR